MKAKAKERPSFVYPPCVTERSGCKVGWRYYATEAEARTAAKVARAEGAYLAGFGYDYGYRSPGSVSQVSKLAANQELAGLWEVVTP